VGVFGGREREREREKERKVVEFSERGRMVIVGRERERRK